MNPLGFVLAGLFTTFASSAWAAGFAPVGCNPNTVTIGGIAASDCFVFSGNPTGARDTSQFLTDLQTNFSGTWDFWSKLDASEIVVGDVSSGSFRLGVDPSPNSDNFALAFKAADYAGVFFFPQILLENGVDVSFSTAFLENGNGRNPGLSNFSTWQSVPEPGTIVGVTVVIAFGVVFKRKVSKENS